MNKLRRMTVLALIALLSVSAVFAQGATEAAPAASPAASTEVKPEQADKTLVIAVPATFEEKWNPFLAESAYDQDVMDQIFVGPIRINKDNEVMPWGGNIETTDNGDGTVTYTVTVKPGMKFSDGEEVTIDDYLYSLYVCADPSYTGPSALITEDIVGIKEYYYDDPNYSSVIAGFAQTAAEKYSLDTISKEDYITYLIESDLEAWWDGVPGDSWKDYAAGEGFADQYAAIDSTDPAAVLALMAEIEYTNYYGSYDPQTWWEAKLAESYIAGNLADGVDVAEISGIKRIDDYTATVTYGSINIMGDRNISFSFVPEHYYGSVVKGDVSSILANMIPLGSGPYVFKGFADNIATVVANVNYFEGVPVIGTVKFQYVPEADALASLASGVIDICNPSGSKENVEELESLGLAYDLTDNAGYGYAGFNCNNLDINVRRGLFSLMNRRASVAGYYGSKIAQVIERPMTTVIAEYPDDAAEFYPYDPAKALEYFKAAGYEQKDGKLVNANGEQLVVSAYIGGSGVGDHPAYAMYTQAANDLAALGGELQINDVQFAVLQAAMNDGTADIFTLAWGNVNNCDKSTQFSSNGGQNRYNIKNDRMDALLEEIMQTVDLAERKALVAEMLDLAMDLAVELPLYQRKNILAYNGDNVDLSSFPAETTAFWDYSSELWKVRMN